jgi:hypothetical protein
MSGSAALTVCVHTFARSPSSYKFLSLLLSSFFFVFLGGFVDPVFVEVNFGFFRRLKTYVQVSSSLMLARHGISCS